MKINDFKDIFFINDVTGWKNVVNSHLVYKKSKIPCYIFRGDWHPNYKVHFMFNATEEINDILLYEGIEIEIKYK